MLWVSMLLLGWDMFIVEQLDCGMSLKFFMFAHANCGMCWIVDHTDCGTCSLWSMFAVEHVLACTAHGDVYMTAHRRTDLKDMKGTHTQKLILP